MARARTCIKDILILLGTKQNISSSSVYTANDKDHLSIFYWTCFGIQTLQVTHRKAWRYLHKSTLSSQTWAEKQTTKIIEKKTNYKCVKTSIFLSNVRRKKEWIYCLLHNHTAFKVKKHFQGQLPSLWMFEGGGACQHIFIDVSITASPQVLRVIDVFLRVLPVNIVEDPQGRFAQGSFS